MRHVACVAKSLGLLTENLATVDLDAAGLWGLHISLPVFLEFFVC